MKIAIDAGPTKSGHAIRGVGFYTKNLLGALGNEVEAVDVNSTNLAKYDLVHIPHFDPFVNTFPSNIEKYKYVLTIHDVIPLLYPKHYPPGLKGKLRFMLQRKKAREARMVITDSETSKKDIVRLLGIKPSKVEVVYLGPQSGLKVQSQAKLDELTKKYNLPHKFVLYIGDVNYNKNIPNLIRACKFAKIPLVIVGKQASEVDNLGQDLRLLKGPMDWFRFILNKPHPQLAHYKAILKEIKNNPDVYRLGFVSPEDLAGIMQLASVYCQPSLYEGFGLPLLEAFSMNLPVVAAQTQALVEVGGDACVYVDPFDYKAMGEELMKVANNQKLRSKLTAKGRKRLTLFSWNKAAGETLKVYEQAA